MKRILFVDDEPRLLEGLQRMLRPQRQQWDMRFAPSGAEALRILEADPVDVIVSDMRMPDMDGATLLERVRDCYPGVIRIILSGHFDVESGLRAVPVAHQFLTKPCDAEKLRVAIERSANLTAVLPDEATRRVVSAVGTLPSPPQICTRLTQAIENCDSSVAQIGKLVGTDVAFAAKVLQLVNSAFFGIPQRVNDVGHAVGYLGLDILRQLIMSIEILQEFHPRYRPKGFSLDAFERHSQLAAGIAARLPAPVGVASQAVTAALLHDTGILILASRLPQEFELVCATSVQSGQPLFMVEKEVLGTTHADVGAYLLGLWGMPRATVDAIARHHQPQLVEGGTKGQLDVAAVVYLADALAGETGSHTPGQAEIPTAGCDMNYLAGLGVEDQLAGWRAMALEVAGAQV